MSSRIALPMIPAALFGIVLGVAGLGFDWRSAHRAWGLPSAVGETILAIAAIIWAVLIVLYTAKCIFARDAALVELGHPVQCCFFGLIGARDHVDRGGRPAIFPSDGLGLFHAGRAFHPGLRTLAHRSAVARRA